MGYEPVPAGAAGGGGGGGVTDHGALTGLADNDHPQYNLASDNLLTHAATTGNKRRLVAGTNVTFDDTAANVRTINATGGGVTDHGALTGLADNDHPQYLLAASAVTDHGALTGLADNDHPQYALATDVPAVSTQTVGVGGQTSIVFSSLNGNADIGYRIRAWGPTLNGGTLTVEINGASTNIKMQNISQSNGGASSNVPANAIGSTRSSTDIFMEFAAGLLGAGQRRAFRGHISAPFDATQWFSHVFTGAYNDTTTNITQIAIVSSTANAFSEGFKASIERIRW